MTARDPNPPSRGLRRTKDDVVDAALSVLDRVGLPDLSMRRLAEDLGVQPSALYWHVASKQELLAAVSARILSPVALRPGDPTHTRPGGQALLPMGSLSAPCPPRSWE